jgi:hypothetical protein
MVIGGWGSFEARHVGDDDNKLQIYQSGADTTYIERVYISGDPLLQTAVGNNSPSGAFRITRVGKQWQGYYRNLGGTWSGMGPASGSPIGRDEVELRIYLQNWTNKPKSEAFINTFIMNSGEYTCMVSSSSSSSSSSQSSSSSSVPANPAAAYRRAAYRRAAAVEVNRSA